VVAVGGEDDSFVVGEADGHFDAPEFVVDLGVDYDGAGLGVLIAIGAGDVADKFKVFAGGRFAQFATDFFDNVSVVGAE